MANVLIPKKSTVAAKVPTTSDLALGEIAINHSDQKLYARHPVSGTVQEIGGGGAGSITIDTTAADLFSATSGTLSADDLGSDKIYFWDDSAGRATGLDLGTGLAITGTTLNNTGSLTGTGSVDNAILRADGTGGSTLQSSGLIVDDAVVAYSVTGDAATDVITATGHNFTANQGVMFPSLTGGTGLNTTTVYFVRDISGDTFKVSTTSGGAAVNFTTNITAGSVIAIQANVAISQNTPETNSALVLQVKGTGALIAGPKPDGTAVGGNARGTRAIDLQTERTNANQVASGNNSVICGGKNNRNNHPNCFIGGGELNTIASIGAQASTNHNIIVGGSGNSITGENATYHVIVGGISNTSNANNSGGGGLVSGRDHLLNGETCFIGGGARNQVSGISSVVCGGGNRYLSLGVGNTASGNYSSILGGFGAKADRLGMQSHASGQFNASYGVTGEGDAQRARFVMRNTTTGTTTAELFLDGSSTRLTIPSGKVMAFTINICGIRNGGADVAHYIRQYALKNLAGTTTQVYAPVTIGTDTATGTTIALSANDTNDALRVEVTGVTGQTWRWVAAIDAVEITAG